LGERLVRQTVETYLAFYAADFKTRRARTARNGKPRQGTHQQTQKDRGRHRIAKVTFKGDSNAVVTFRQIRSDSLKISSSKNLVRSETTGRWQDPAGASWGLMSKRIFTCVAVAALAFESLALSPAKGRRVGRTRAPTRDVYDEIVQGNLECGVPEYRGLIRVKPNFRLLT